MPLRSDNAFVMLLQIHALLTKGLIFSHFCSTLREIYKYVKDDIEKLYARVPAHMRMDLPLPPQALHPSAPSSGGEFVHLQRKLKWFFVLFLCSALWFCNAVFW